MHVLRRVFAYLRGSRAVRWIFALAVLLLIFEYIVLPQLVGSDNVLRALGGLSPVLLAAAAALEAASLCCYSALTRAVLPGSRRPGYFTLLRIDLADQAVNHVVPGGGTTSAAVRYKLLTQAGVRPQDALSAAMVQVVGANLVLGVLFAVGLLAALGQVRGNQYFVTAGAVVLVLLLLSGAALSVLDRHLEGAVHAARRIASWVRVVKPESAERFVRTMAAETEMFRQEPARLAQALLLSVCYWLFDAACLWTFVAAFGHALNPGELLVAYGLGNLVALAPLTPGGLGLVEGVMVPTLVGFGAANPAAVLGVLSWRIANFWLPIPVGGLAWLSLRVGVLRRHSGAPRHPAPPGTGGRQRSE
ncbi:lysylphosphatidylglycerol synthase transmembrane domain-containing protein [Arthrobacter caoxuetaonis]|uniref:Flippase-like domain-containing protein n=1 Tax=Arthrobacter caoxuetaonis TaxID=2886935 RepID=A0A9X1MEM6_9MICC|nr:lysylphosphatidylglycerol synthase transmembrane domain-containing protein [Arthrobacter caoxuetaonis]MCC3297932.1 flippase-like domain-containing protein [Arthrobacter caoxuetaonis]USQ55884.1 flippase-like domain-containing protein [Arthrobacter caoxuetaonis]